MMNSLPCLVCSAIILLAGCSSDGDSAEVGATDVPVGVDTADTSAVDSSAVDSSAVDTAAAFEAAAPGDYHID